MEKAAARFSLLQAEPTASVFLEHRIIGAATEGSKIVSVDAVQARGGHERRFKGRMFIDTTGTAMLGVLAGAETLFGREARSEFNEPYAPEVADDMHHGNTLLFRTRIAEHAVPFPEVPWATAVSKDYANLSGQLIKPGVENGPGPIAGANPPTLEFRFGSFTVPFSNVKRLEPEAPKPMSFRPHISGSTASGSIPTRQASLSAIT